MGSSDDERNPASLIARISPPRLRRGLTGEQSAKDEGKRGNLLRPQKGQSPLSLNGAQTEKVPIQDHLAYFTTCFRQVSRPAPILPDMLRISIDDLASLYRRHQSPHGHHFVVHQHDHPVAGPHYDLRLQFSESSSISFAIMYGLPGDPNSKRLSRNAIETRVHNLWVCDLYRWCLIFIPSLLEPIFPTDSSHHG